MCDKCDIEKARLLRLAEQNLMPCVVCGSTEIIGYGTWMPGEDTYLAAGGSETSLPIFAFCVCEEHAAEDPDNHKLIEQGILRDIRECKGCTE